MDALDAAIAGRVQPRGVAPIQDYFPGFDPEAYNPAFDLGSLYAPNNPAAAEIQRQTEGLKAIGSRMRDTKESQAALLGLQGLDPENPLYEHQINSIFSDNPDAITNPRVANLLRLQQSVARKPEFTAEDITDPELLAKWKEREAAGVNWRENHQQHLMDAATKQKRLELRGMGASPEELRAIMDPKTGHISDDDYAGIKYHLAANQKQPMTQAHAEKLAELETAAEREPSPEEKASYLKQTYPKLSQAQYTPSYWEEAYNALTPKRNVLKHYLNSLVYSGVAVDPQLMSKYGIQPRVTRWDPKGKKVLVDTPVPVIGNPITAPSQLDQGPVVVHSKEQWASLAPGTKFVDAQGRSYTKK